MRADRLLNGLPDFGQIAQLLTILGYERLPFLNSPGNNAALG